MNIPLEITQLLSFLITYIDKNNNGSCVTECHSRWSSESVTFKNLHLLWKVTSQSSTTDIYILAG